MSMYDILYIFLIYGFLGWCTEVAFAAFKHRKFVNRGFLYSPICPIYGIGVLCVVSVLNVYAEKTMLLYITSVIITTVLEWITGFLLEKLFHHKWWDYSNIPFNISGYVCLPFSLIWGIACVVIIKWIHPFFMKFIMWIPKPLGVLFLIVATICLVVDICITVQGILNMNIRLSKMQELADELQKLSIKIGTNISDNVLDSIETQEAIKKRIEEVKEKYQELIGKQPKMYKRIIRAFPNIKSHRYEQQMEKLKEFLARKKDGEIK